MRNLSARLERRTAGAGQPLVIPFPGVMPDPAWKTWTREMRKGRRGAGRNLSGEEARKEDERRRAFDGYPRLWRPRVPGNCPIDGGPGKSLPDGCPDYRPLLQRDGLILLGWEERPTRRGPRWRVYWVTSTGTRRCYASRDVEEKDLSEARPDFRSQGFGENPEGLSIPVCIVHTAPELLRGRDPDLRKEHIRELLALGVPVNFDYRYLLGVERRKAILRRRIQNNLTHRL